MTEAALRAFARAVPRVLQTAALAALAACGGAPGTPQQEIRTLIEQAAAAAEDGDFGRLADALHPAYRDMRGNDRAAALRLLRLTLMRADGLLVHTDIERIEVAAADTAAVALTARFAAADLGRLALEGGAYRFELDLANAGGDWQVISARWSRAGERPR